MYGYVRPSPNRLTPEEKELFQSAYCGLCRTMGRRCGQLSRLLLNYDFTFLAVLFHPGTGSTCRRCVAAPCRGRPGLEEDEPLALAADCTVILAWWQLRDKVSDSGFFRGLPHRFLSWLFRGAYRRAAAARPDFDRHTRTQLDRLAALERENCPALDPPADTFAVLLAGAAEGLKDPVERRVLGEMCYHLGRWVYLADAADDLEKDVRTGQYNPLVGRFGLTDGRWTAEAREALGATMDQSIRRLAAAFELGEFGPWAGIIRSAVYEGLYAVGHAVLTGTFRRPGLRVSKRHKEQL